MRHSKTIKINSRLSVTAFCLSVSQIAGLFFSARELSFPEQQENFNSLVREQIFNDLNFVVFSDVARAKKLNQDEKNKVETFFYQVNADFFMPKPANDYSQCDAPVSFTGEDTFQDFVRLIWANPEIANYSYSVLKVMIDNSGQWQEEMSHG